MSKLLEEIKKLALLDPFILDDLVHEELSRSASIINNEGIERQVEFLSENGYSLDEIYDLLNQSD